MLFKKFFVVSGVGLSKISKLNAFDKALMEAGISQCNLVPVSSILPKGAKQIKPKNIEPGTITFTVLARSDGDPKTSVSAGLGWAFCTDAKGRDTYGVVIEEYEFKNVNKTKKSIMLKLKEMSDVRGMKIKRQCIKTRTMERIPPGHYGSAVVALIYAE